MTSYQFIPDEPRMIVIAWLVEEFEIIKLGRADLGIGPKLRMVLAPRACAWVNEGTAEDIEKAEAYARGGAFTKAEGTEARVFVYPKREEDPIGRAKRELTEVSKKEDAP